MLEKTFRTVSSDETQALGNQIGAQLCGGEVIEFSSDLGGGKTTFVRGLAQGFGSLDVVASPSFTISYVYTRADGKALYHFDFYRLNDPGIVANELAEVEGDKDVVVAIEWGEQVHNVLPAERIHIQIKALSDNEREICIKAPPAYAYLFDNLQEARA
ncbi:MAG: tRNA (adenosine(37)-N6)-threonylcarbamoyltransferase complex ATPase subunit type 1 TsaE [Candidatus Saccharimonadales bacterium]